MTPSHDLTASQPRRHFSSSSRRLGLRLHQWLPPNQVVITSNANCLYPLCHILSLHSSKTFPNRDAHPTPSFLVIPNSHYSSLEPMSGPAIGSSCQQILLYSPPFRYLDIGKFQCFTSFAFQDGSPWNQKR